ncbi:MAG: large conductance mechanosensitive channel protein MscL [Clostridia bacterium]|nr:large conductance mechanosensitive channel protein MscL [Clostridia bacterium]
MKKLKDKSTSFWKDFKAFITRGNVVDMAIGVVVANAFKDIVNKFTSSFINPLVAYMTGDKSLVDLKYVIVPQELDEAGAVIQKEIAFTWGIFLQSIVDFLIIAFVLFIVLRIASHIAKKAKEARERLSEEEQAAADAAAAEAKAKADAEAAAKAEAEAAAKAAADAEIAAAKAREIETVELLREIRNSLKK